jgi:alpha-beta hydrolase superfamily lysophospholipase
VARGHPRALRAAGALAALALAGCAQVRVPVRFAGPDQVEEVVIPGLVACDEGRQPAHLDPRQPVHVLVHGTNSSNEKFETLAEVFAASRQQAVCFTYDDRDSLERSSAVIAQALDALQRRMVSRDLVVLGHSQGGLVARRALTRDRRDGASLDAPGTRIRLVTVATPFAGVPSARNCGSVARHMLSFGLTSLICHFAAGPKWLQIFPTSSFIQRPGDLVAHVTAHLKINTDEEGACLSREKPGQCTQSDSVFRLADQFHDAVDDDPRVRNVVVRAGHVEIVGETGVPPFKLVEVLQEHRILVPPAPAGKQAFAALLTALYR